MKKFFICLPLVMLFFIVSCTSTTKITRVWSDAELVKKYNSVLVIGVFHRPNARKLVEDSFASHVGAEGAKIITSYGTIQDLSFENRRKLVHAIKSTGAEAVLVVRLIELKDKKEYKRLSSYKVPFAYYSKLQSYLRETELDEEETSDAVIYGIAVAEANLYDIASEKLIWTAVSDLHLQDSSTVIMQSFAKAIAKKLADGGVI